MKKLILFILLASNSFATHAMNTGGYFQVDQVYAWSGKSTGGPGYFLVTLESKHPLCPDGYWLQDTTAAHSSTYVLELALSAYHSKSRVLIYADENSDWAHLPTTECEIQLIVLEN